VRLHHRWTSWRRHWTSPCRWLPIHRTLGCRSRTWWPTSGSSSSTCSARRGSSKAACGWRPPSTPPIRSWPWRPSPPPQREGRPLGRPGQHRDQDRLHPGHGGRQRLRQLQVQPGRPGAPPSRFRFQDLRADRSHREGDQPLRDPLRVDASQHQAAGRGQALDRQDLQRQLRRTSIPIDRATLRSDNTCSPRSPST
jgi:hypothetical protein